MPTRVAVIGTGFGSTVQVPGFQQLDDVEVVAIASGRLERAQEVASRFGIPNAFDDYVRMLDQVEVDLVSIATPPYLHREMVGEVIQRRRNVLCEKPFALSVAEATEMLDQARDAGVVHAVDHEFRFTAGRSAVKEQLEAGFVGEPRVVQLLFRLPARMTADSAPFDWWSERERGGGLLGAIGSHYIDSLRWWFGEPHDVAGRLDSFVRHRKRADGSLGEVTSDDTASLVMRCGPSNVHVSATLSMAVAARGSRLEVIGTEGTLVLEDDARLFGAKPGEALAPLPVTQPRFAAQPGQMGPITPFLELATRVLDAVRGQPTLDYPTFEDGLAVQRVLDAAYASG